MLGQDFTEAQRTQLIQDLGLDQPFFMQFATFIGNAVQGEFGMSYRLSRAGRAADRRARCRRRSNSPSLRCQLGAGRRRADGRLYRRSTAIPGSPRLFMTFSLIGVSLPTFLIGILLILIFSVWLGWLPSFGRGDVGADRLVDAPGFLTWSGLKALILPAITLGLFQMTLIMRLVRSEMLEVLRTDYIKFARARGLSNRAINFGHALKNTLVPVITITGLQLGGIIAFAIITETVFQWPGMGLLFIQRCARRHPGHGGLPDADRAGVRGDQPGGRPALLRSSIRGCGSAAARPGGTEMAGCPHAAPSTATSGRYASRRSPVTVGSAVVALVCILGALLRAVDRAAQPVRPRHAEPARAFKPPRLGRGRRSHASCWAPTTRGATCSRPSCTARASRCWSGFCAVAARGLRRRGARPARRLSRRHGGRAADAHRRHAAHLPGDPDRAAGGRRGPRRAAAGACTTRSRSTSLIFAIGISVWPQFARTVRGSTLVERNKEYVLAARVIGLSRLRIMLTHVLPNVIGPVLVIAHARARLSRSSPRRRCPSSASACRRPSPRSAR